MSASNGTGTSADGSGVAVGEKSSRSEAGGDSPFAATAGGPSTKKQKTREADDLLYCPHPATIDAGSTCAPGGLWDVSGEVTGELRTDGKSRQEWERGETQGAAGGAAIVAGRHPGGIQSLGTEPPGPTPLLYPTPPSPRPFCAPSSCAGMDFLNFAKCSPSQDPRGRRSACTFQARPAETRPGAGCGTGRRREQVRAHG